MNLDQILDEAIKLDASDVHLICDNKPMLRVARILWLFSTRKCR